MLGLLRTLRLVIVLLLWYYAYGLGEVWLICGYEAIVVHYSVCFRPVFHNYCILVNWPRLACIQEPKRIGDLEGEWNRMRKLVTRERSTRSSGRGFLARSRFWGHGRIMYGGRVTVTLLCLKEPRHNLSIHRAQKSYRV